MCALILQFINASKHSLPYEPQGKFYINDTYCLLCLYVKLELPIRLHWKHFSLRRGSTLRLFHFRLTVRADHIHWRQLKLRRWPEKVVWKAVRLFREFQISLRHRLLMVAHTYTSRATDQFLWARLAKAGGQKNVQDGLIWHGRGRLRPRQKAICHRTTQSPIWEEGLLASYTGTIAALDLLFTRLVNRFWPAKLELGLRRPSSDWH